MAEPSGRRFTAVWFEYIWWFLAGVENPHPDLSHCLWHVHLQAWGRNRARSSQNSRVRFRIYRIYRLFPPLSYLFSPLSQFLPVTYSVVRCRFCPYVHFFPACQVQVSRFWQRCNSSSSSSFSSSLILAPTLLGLISGVSFRAMWRAPDAVEHACTRTPYCQIDCQILYILECQTECHYVR